MKWKWPLIIFTAFLVVMASLFRVCSGPFYFGNNSDPSYFYLYNFLYILEGKSPAFVDHPGTTLDVLGAMIIKIFFAPRSNTPWLMTNALRAESVLGVVWFSMVLMYAATFMILGFYTLKRSQDKIFTGLVLLSSLWLIMVPSFSAQGILPISANVNSDTMMMTAVNLMLLAILRFYFSLENKSLSHVISLGLAVAFALATKFTALPFVVVAFFVLVTWQQRVLLGAVMITGFILLTCPIWGSYQHMMLWVQGLIIDRGMHGSNGVGFDAVAYFQHFVQIIKYYWFFAVVWVLAGGIALWAKPQIDTKIRKILLAVALGGLCQVIIVAKQPSLQYMAPMIGVSSLGLAFVYKAFPEGWRKGFQYAVMFILAVSLGLIARSLWQVNENTQKTRAMLDTISKDYSSYWVCPFYRSSMPGFGLIFWNNVIIRSDYGTILKKYYPDLVYYDIFGKDFKDSAHQVVPFSLLRQLRGRVLLYGTDRELKSLEPYITVNKIYSNGTEALYEVISARSSLGLEYLQLARLMYDQGHYEDAYKAAVVSQQLGVGQDISSIIGMLKAKVQ